MWTFEYRLGDIVRSRVHPWFPWKHCDYAPRSIACEYLRATRNLTTRHGHYDVLEHVIRRRMKNKPRIHRLALHVRLGDTLDTPPYSEWCKNAEACGCRYVYPLCSYKTLLKNFTHTPVMLFTNVSKGVVNRTSPTSSAQYLRHLMALHRGRFTFTRHKNADDDFVAMLRSEFLVPSYGGQYAKLLRMMAPRFGTRIPIITNKCRRCATKRPSEERTATNASFAA